MLNNIGIIRQMRGSTVLEFALLMVIVVMACIGLQALLRRSIQGRLKSSSDTLGSQFSPLWTNETKFVAMDTRTLEQTVFGNITRFTNRTMNSTVLQTTGSPRLEAEELRPYL